MIHLIFTIMILAVCISLVKDFLPHLWPAKMVCPDCQSTQGSVQNDVWTCRFCKKAFPIKTSLFNQKIESAISPEIRLVVTLYAKVTKLDGVVTKQEIQVVDRLIKSHYRPTEKQLVKIRMLFNSTKGTPTGAEVIIHKLERMLPEGDPLRVRILDDLFQIAMADNPLDDRQEHLIFKASQLFHISNFYPAIRKRYIPEVDKHYLILECSETDSLETIKKNYRRLIKQHHPDRFVHHENATDIIQMANQKIKEIQQAYETVRRSKTQTPVN